MTAPRIREAREEDVEAILAVVEAAYRGEGGWTTEAHLVGGTRTQAREVRDLLADPGVILLVAETEDGTVRGCCYTARHGEDAELGLFAVYPRAQSGGIGGRLLEAQVERRREAGARAVEIHVLQNRPELHAWYRRHGFVPTGATIPFPGAADDLRVAGLRMEVMQRPLTGPAEAPAGT